MNEVDIQKIAEAGRQIKTNIEKIIVGKSDVIELVLISVFCEGHILLEDVPGIGKTMLARSIARSLKCQFRRIQCTPDLLPSDITGTYIYNQKNGDFEYRPGPIFTQIVLADEINRATPRSQSAMLEAMEERQVTLEGETRLLPRPFLVIATQNPVELEGTFPLPEAQMDRFLMRLKIGYTTETEDSVILERFVKENPIESLEPVIDGEQVLKLQKACRQVFISLDIQKYIIHLVRATRSQPHVELGASPRAMLGLYRSAQALAALRGRSFVLPDDVKYLAPFIMAHRIIPEASVSLKGGRGEDIVQAVLETIPAPVEAEPSSV
jgi:MoxR-like ATPase